jgi:tetratricopeptide (TPR) repeat protein
MKHKNRFGLIRLVAKALSVTARRSAPMAFVALLSIQAWAQPATTARDHYKRGTTMFDLGRYLDAAKEYEAAFELKDDPVLLFNIAQAYRLGRSYPDAARSYRAYLRRLPEAKNRDEVLARLREMQSLADQQARSEQKPPVGTAPLSDTKQEPAPETAPIRSVTTSQPPAQALNQSAATSPRETPRRADRPVYKKWWLWTIVGGVVAAGVVVGVTVAVLSNESTFNPSLGKVGPSALSVSF